MDDRDRRGMQGKPLDALLLDAVFFVAGHGTTLVGEMDPDLILPAGQQVNFEKTVPDTFFQNFIPGFGELTSLWIRNGIHFVGAVFRQAGSNDTLFIGQGSVDDGIVRFLKSLPRFLEMLLSIVVLRKHDDTGSLPVQAMHDEHPVS